MPDLIRCRHLLFVLFFIGTAARAQFDDRQLSGGEASAIKFKQDSYFSKATELIDLPTASVLRPGDIRLGLRMYEEGGMLGKVSVGISNRIMFGVSYGGLNMIGNGEPDWNPTQGVHVSYRVMEETLALPALVIGFDSQGYGRHLKSFYNNAPRSQQRSLSDSGHYDRYSIKSRGFFVVVSKGYSPWIKMGLHAGMNLSLEQKDDGDPTIFMAADAIISRDIAVLAEYDFATNDDKIRGGDSGKGFLNFGLRWAFYHSMYLEFAIEDLLSKPREEKLIYGSRRIFKFVFHGRII